MCSTPFRVVLGIVNVIFGIVGLAVAVAGAVLAWGRPIIEKYMRMLLDKYKERVDEELQGHLDQATELVLKYSAQIGIVIFAFGLIILFIAILGCIGACCNNKCILIIYATFIGILVVAHTIILIFYFARRDLLLKYINKELKKLIYQYESLSSGQSNSILVGVLMTVGNCCGYKNGSDFMDPNSKFTGKEVVDGRELNVSYPVPCCRHNQNGSLNFQKTRSVIPNINDIAKYNNTCPFKFTKMNSNIDKGCKEPTDKFIIKILDLVAFWSIAVLLLNIIVLILAVLSIVL